MRQSTQRGFTLIELMVVVAIILVFTSVLVGMRSGTYGGNPKNTAEELANHFNTTKMRAVSTRRWHRAEITPTALTVYQWSATGMTTPAGTCSTSSGTITNCWEQLTTYKTENNVLIWEALTTLYSTTGGATIASKDTALDFSFYFKPDGSVTSSTTSSGTSGTVFIADNFGNVPYRVAIYPATGSSIARAGW
jgi:prepilin-type N-terminal cleavage/methylation domain-containing protein